MHPQTPAALTGTVPVELYDPTLDSSVSAGMFTFDAVGNLFITGLSADSRNPFGA